MARGCATDRLQGCRVGVAFVFVVVSGSAGRSEVLVEDLCRSAPVERLARPAVQGGGYGGEVVGAVAGEVGALREVLAQEAVGVLVGGALPGALRVAEVDRQIRCRFEARRAGPSRRPGPRSASGAAARAT